MLTAAETAQGASEVPELRSIRRQGRLDPKCPDHSPALCSFKPLQGNRRKYRWPARRVKGRTRTIRRKFRQLTSGRFRSPPPPAPALGGAPAVPLALPPSTGEGLRPKIKRKANTISLIRCF